MSQNDFNNDAQQGGATFGEYKSTTTKTTTTTNMGGVDTQQGGATFGEYQSTTTNMGGVDTQQGGASFGEYQATGGASFGEYQSTQPSFARASTRVTYNPNVIQAKTTIAPTKTLPTKYLPTISKDHLGQVKVDSSSSSNFDINAFTSTSDSGANFGGDFQATTTTTTTETTTGGFDMSKFGGAEGGVTTGFDASAFQSGDATVDTGANFGGDFQATTTTTTTTETTNFGGFDAQFAGGETSTTLQTDQTFDLNNLQTSGQEGAGFEFNAQNTETPLVDTTSALKDYGTNSAFNEYQTTKTTKETTTTTTNFEGLQGFDFNNLQAGSSSDFSALQTTTTESNFEAGTASSYDEGNANKDAIPSTTLEPAMDLGQFGGQTTVQTTTTTTITTSDVDSGAAAYGEYKSTKALNSVPAVPNRTLDTLDAFQNGEGSSEATVTPLKGSFAISKNKYVGGMSKYNQAAASMEEGNVYNASTHSDLRGNIGSKGTASAGGFTSFSEYAVTKDFNTRTYNPQS